MVCSVKLKINTGNINMGGVVKVDKLIKLLVCFKLI